MRAASYSPAWGSVIGCVQIDRPAWDGRPAAHSTQSCCGAAFSLDPAPAGAHLPIAAVQHRSMARAAGQCCWIEPAGTLPPATD